MSKKNDDFIIYESGTDSNSSQNVVVQPNLSAMRILPLRNMTMFPEVTMPVAIIRDSSHRLVSDAFEHHYPIGVLCQIDPENDNPQLKDLYQIGVVANVVKLFDLPDGSCTAIVEARSAMKVICPADTKQPSEGIVAEVELLSDKKVTKTDIEFPVIVDIIRKKTSELLEKSENEPNVQFAIKDCPDDLLINMVATTIPVEATIKQSLLEIRSVKKRGLSLLSVLSDLEGKMNLIESINHRTQSSLNDQQRNAFLQQQMETIRHELYGDSDDAENLRTLADSVAFPEEVERVFYRELEKLQRLNPQSPDYSVLLTYLETLLDLPWGVFTPNDVEFKKASEVLNRDHYGLEKVKNRILEQLAVMINNPKGKAPIICLVGPPGVGKTSLGQSIARALGRKYQRVSLGGLHDEAEIRGHRRTYVGAMPGRIIDAVRRAGSANPVLLLDEVDKIGADYKGDPSAALLEVLDPEQNCHFHDNYIDVDYDLSNVLFIATANTLQTLSQPLLDRMEVIEISGYLLEEKVEIAKQHIIPRLLKLNNLKSSALKFSKEAIEAIIENYTSESGVRQLEKQLATIVRKSILAIVSGEKYHKKINPAHLHDLLGVERYSKDRYEGNEFAGVVTGLAWTAVGGEILFIETSLAKGKGEKLTLTGNLGDVMKESATIALQYVKANADSFGIDESLFEKYNVHIHVPEGAIPKDGPSAGITMATSLISAFTRRKVKARLAMTGEITLRGKVLPVGGIKEKILAAKRAGIREIIISSENRKDINDIASNYVEGLTFHYVDTVKDVYEIALTDDIAK